MSAAIKPLYERGHHCKVCGRTTIHDYFAQQSTDGEEVLHFWRCRECGVLVCLDSPEEFAERCFRRETRRMRQRRSRRRNGYMRRLEFGLLVIVLILILGNWWFGAPGI